MSMLERRLQILIDEERHRRIVAVARERGMSVGAVVRDAIDRGLATPDTRRRSAGSRVLGAPPMDVPDVDALLDELDDLRARRA
jgi:hypothetical protein